MPDLIRQRVYGLVAGYEEINDHERLKYDPLLATAVGKEDPLGEERCTRDQGKALAGKSTLNRFELGAQEQTGLHRIHANADAIESYFIEAGVAAIPADSREIILDFDATDDLFHGMQEVYSPSSLIFSILIFFPCPLYFLWQTCCPTTTAHRPPRLRTWEYFPRRRLRSR